MTASDHTLDPHLEEVLRDIENDPRARMFQTSPRQLVTGLRERAPRIGTQQFGLTSAERELVQVHREEVAQLLCTAAKTAIVESDKSRTPIGRWVTVDKKLELPSREQWLAQARYCRSVLPGELHPIPATALLGQRIANGGAVLPSPYDMALASMRLVPRTGTRIVLALTLMELGEDHSALRILQDVLQSRCLPLMRSIALVNLSLVHFQDGRIDHAIEDLGASRDLHANRLSPALNALCLHLRLGNRADALRAGEWMGSVADSDHPAITDFVLQRKRRISLPQESPTTNCLRLIPMIRDELTPAARRVADVYSA